MRYYLITSEAVTEGHPDKMCDQISDAILDEYLSQDPFSKVAIECMISKDCLMIAGEVSSHASVDITKTAKAVIKSIGYTNKQEGFDYNNCLILTNINKQSPDIAMGVEQGTQIGAGDQGIMYGYACDETPTLMPLSAFLANALARELARVRKENILPWLLPDGKTQVTIKYNENNHPMEITSIVVSAQHQDSVSSQDIHGGILKNVIQKIIPKDLINTNTKIHINPTGRFVIGGPLGDTGLTGRKIIADTYGGVAKHGGGAFSGKDGTKVDRSASYMARYVAKNLVASGLCKKCEVSLSYAIGLPTPEAFRVNTFGTGVTNDSTLETIAQAIFSFSVADIITTLNLRQAQFINSAAYGHFGNESFGFAWEQTDKANTLKEIYSRIQQEGLV